ncbi:trp operon leader peptide [Salmonella enterica subsp. enterica]|nr:trp operon leader peptide [Salmonella enterica subsp. enterica serovar Veneziana]EDR2899302.1 trp operon leader peptide [Salmonella enterica subsp. enterica serovar Amherstiana]
MTATFALHGWWRTS